MAKISIIIPCHNVENYIMRCFESLRNQTIGLDQLELLFIDDASTDRTWDILSEIEQLAPDSVGIIHLGKNIRQGGARNVGLSYASCEYVGFVDADDWVEPDMYECLYRAITDAETDLAFCRHVRDNGKDELLLNETAKNTDKKNRTLRIVTDEHRVEFIISNIIGYGVWDKLFRKDFLLENEIFFPEQLTYEDIYFGSLVYLYANRVSIVERILYHYYINETSTVLGRNQVHHKDIFEINYMKWDAYKLRGFLDRYRKALEFDFIMSFYMAGFKILALRFDEIPFDAFMKLKKGTLERVPDFENNEYCRSHITEIYQLLLQLLKIPVTHEQLIDIQKAFCEFHRLADQ
nr:glycosyltransferase family 2 protein [Lachnospiraceae bacterium]